MDGVIIAAIITKDGSFNDKIPNKVCVVSQTTEKEENWDKTINNLSIILRNLYHLIQFVQQQK